MTAAPREMTSYLFSSTVGNARRYMCCCCICLTKAERRRMRRTFKFARRWRKASRTWKNQSGIAATVKS